MPHRTKEGMLERIQRLLADQSSLQRYHMLPCIIIDGPRKAGKTTHCKLLQSYLTELCPNIDINILNIQQTDIGAKLLSITSSERLSEFCRILLQQVQAFNMANTVDEQTQHPASQGKRQRLVLVDGWITTLMSDELLTNNSILSSVVNPKQASKPSVQVFQQWLTSIPLPHPLAHFILNTNVNELNSRGGCALYDSHSHIWLTNYSADAIHNVTCARIDTTAKVQQVAGVLVRELAQILNEVCLTVQQSDGPAGLLN